MLIDRAALTRTHVAFRPAIHVWRNGDENDDEDAGARRGRRTVESLVTTGQSAAVVLDCPPTTGSGEDPDFLTRQLITCIGNKRALLGPIGDAVEKVKRRLGRSRLRVLDAFSGSGVVSRFLKAHASRLVANDLEDYAVVAARCHLQNRSSVNRARVSALVEKLNRQVETLPHRLGFIEELYAPRDEARIGRRDRVFYTRDNARRLDAYRRLIEEVDPRLRDLLLGPLLSKASVHANTAGVFKGFYKDRRTRIGRFGGSGGDALLRIRGPIRLEPPVLSRFECDCDVLQGDAIDTARAVRHLDLAYLDPPYNQHPYGSNYFMLNLLVSYRRPRRISRVAGIPADWRRSGYNTRARSLPLMTELIGTIDAPFLLVSYNNEGFIPPDAMREMLGAFGRVEVLETPYTTFRGSRNLHARSIRVTEQLFLVERD